MSKIKSIKLKTNFWFYKKGKVFTFAEFQEVLDSYCSNAPEPMQVDQESTESYLLESPEDFEIKHEKPQILKRPDGSLISGLEEGQDIIVITTNGYDIIVVEEVFGQHTHMSLRQGYVYLRSDTDLAEKKAKMLSKQFVIQLEIDRLNAVEHPSIEKEWHIGYFQNNDKIYKHNLYGSSKDTFMSELTAETILAKYSQDELKQYLGIII
jgi:hypothetical protein